MKKAKQLLVICYQLLVVAGLFWVGTAPVVAETVTNLTVIDGTFFGDGVGLTNIPVTAVVNPENGVNPTNYATALGGFCNAALGEYSTVPGGRGNVASGNYSLAAGQNAGALNEGAFVWADASQTNQFYSITNHCSPISS